MKNKKMLTALFVTVMFVFAPFLCASLQGQTIELRFATPYPKTHPFTKADYKWIEKIEKETKGRVKFTVYVGGVLFKSRDDWPSLVKGVADVAMAGGSYQKTGFEIMQAVRMFHYGCPNAKVARKVHAGYFPKFPEAAAQWKNAKMLSLGYLTPYQVHTAKKPIRKIEDFKGLQLKSLSHHMGPLKEVGAVGMNVPMTEAYVALQKNTVDGLMAPTETLKSFKFAEVVKYSTKLNLGTGANYARGMNWNSWNKLPADIQKIFEDNSEYWFEQIAYELETLDESAVEYAKGQGVEFIELPKEDLKTFYKALETASLKEAARLDKMGLPGTAVFKEVRRLIELYTQ
ncbi:TRAP transporter substrate-binding protein [Thermodesulfobacteriota bacterium]